MEGRKVLVNDALDTFYLRLYGVRYVGEDHSDSEKICCCQYIGYSFRLVATVILYSPSHRQNDQFRSECFRCTFRASCCSARLSRAQVPAFACSSVRDRKRKGGRRWMGERLQWRVQDSISSPTGVGSKRTQNGAYHVLFIPSVEHRNEK